MLIIKICPKCKTPHAPTERKLKHKNYYCSPCDRAQKVAYRALRKAQGRPVKSGTRMPIEWQREEKKRFYSNPENRKRRQKTASLRARHPDVIHKTLCRRRTQQAIYSGKLIRKPCEKCGDPKVEAHHEDYYKPLEIVWLCQKHHIEHHKTNK
jgi:hypothetical protein